MRLGKGLSKGSSQDSRRTAWCKPHSAQAIPELDTKRRDIAAPAHLGALIAAKPRIQAMIQARYSHSWPSIPLETRLDAVIETATSANFDSLDSEDQAMAKLHVQKAAQAADEAWQQTVDGHNGPVVTNPTVSELEHSGSASHNEDSDDMEFSSTPRKSHRSCKRSFHGSTQ